MDITERYDIQETEDGLTLFIKLDLLHEEYSNEFQNTTDSSNESFNENLKSFIKEKFPNLKINLAKVVVGTTIICTIPLSAGVSAASSHTVKSGDTLWKIANNYGVSVDALKKLNHLSSDTIIVGQNLEIPANISSDVSITLNGKVLNITPAPTIINGSTYVPVRAFAELLGGSVWWNSASSTVGINKDDTKVAFVLKSSVARINGQQVSMEPSLTMNRTTYASLNFLANAFGLSTEWDGKTNTVNIHESSKENVYTVQSNDTLWNIANKFNISVSSLKSVNNLTSDTIYPGQVITIPTGGPDVVAVPDDTANKPIISYKTHTVAQGDNIWDLSIYYGIPMSELLTTNNLTMNSSLSIGQKLTIPVHNIPVQPVISENHGELLDWWTEAQFVFAINDVAKITDFQTGVSFYVKRTFGANHADCEPLTAKDSEIIKDVWGGAYNWTSRAVIVEVDGRKIAASMSSTPHDIQNITDNNFDGHFDIHFLNSTRHKDGLITESHQKQVHIAAGY